MTTAHKAHDQYVYVCTGSDCAKDKKKLRNLKQTISAEAKVKRVKCQKICDGPVAGIMIEGTLTWFEELNSAKRRESLLYYLQTGKTNKTLKKQICKKRTGKLR